MEHLERAVQRLEDSVGRGRKVKEDVEAEVVEEKVEVSGHGVLRYFLGGRAAGAIMDMP